MTEQAARTLNLSEIRKEIDQIDREMVILFEKRLACVSDVARYKYANHQPIFDAVREKAVIDKNTSRLAHPENADYYRLFMQNLMDLCKKVEREVIDAQTEI